VLRSCIYQLSYTVHPMSLNQMFCDGWRSVLRLAAAIVIACVANFLAGAPLWYGLAFAGLLGYVFSDIDARAVDRKEKLQRLLGDGPKV